jgi:hypothetical protein
MSTNGGADWEPVTSGLRHEFTVTGDDLRWFVVMTGPKDMSVHVNSIEIIYEYNGKPTTPVLGDLGASNNLGFVTLEWTPCFDDVGVAEYQVQVSEFFSFTELTKTYSTQDTSQLVFGLKKGEFNFRVRAVDDEGLASEWSNIRSIEITGQILSPWMIAIYSIILVLVVGGIVVAVILVRKRKKIPAR